MSLQIESIPDVPEETRRVAQAAFPKGNRWIWVRDKLGAIYTDEDFSDLFPPRGQPASAPWRLALVLIMQYAEGYSDEEAATAMRSRIDWKYALSLRPISFDSSIGLMTSPWRGHDDQLSLN